MGHRSGRGDGGFVKYEFFCVCFFFFVFFFFFFFIESIAGRLYNIQNSKLCFRDMKIMSLRNGGDFPADSLFTKSPPFLRDIIFISRKHRLLFSI